MFRGYLLLPAFLFASGPHFGTDAQNWWTTLPYHARGILNSHFGPGYPEYGQTFGFQQPWPLYPHYAFQNWIPTRPSSNRNTNSFPPPPPIGYGVGSPGIQNLQYSVGASIALRTTQRPRAASPATLIQPQNPCRPGYYYQNGACELDYD